MSLRVHYEILNQKGTPAFFSDTYANRPAFGFAGRVFISTDTGQIFEDTGSAWTLIADAGVGGGTLASVTANGNTTATGIVITAGGLSSNSLTDTDLTSGSVLFSGAGGVISQDNTNLFWDDTNNRLGISTITPGAKLDIHGTGTIVQLNGTTTNNAYLQFQNSGTGKWRIGNNYNAGANSFDLYNNNTASIALSFDSTTNVAYFPNSIGIGTNAPSAGVTSYSTTAATQFKAAGTSPAFTFSNTLTSPTLGCVFGLATATNDFVTGTVAGDMSISNQSSTPGAIVFGTGTTEKMRLASNGNVGIGISSPVTKLDVRSASATIDNYQTIHAFSTDSAAIDKGGGIALGGYYTGTTNIAMFGSIVGRKENATSGNYSGYLAFATNNNSASNTERMRINSSGNLLIGITTDNGYKLQVNGGIVAVNDALYTSNTASATTYGWANSGAGTLLLRNAGVANVGSFAMATGVYTPISDVNRKKDFELSNIGLNSILGLKPTMYRMKEEDNTEKHLGFIAQEVKEFIPQAYIESGDFIGLDYQAIVSTLVKAVQELNEKLERNNIN